MNNPQTRREVITQKAAQMWADFTPNEKAGVRFGMFPAVRMQAAERDGFIGRDGHALVCALMDCAAKDGGMRA